MKFLLFFLCIAYTTHGNAAINDGFDEATAFTKEQETKIDIYIPKVSSTTFKTSQGANITPTVDNSQIHEANSYTPDSSDPKPLEITQ